MSDPTRNSYSDMDLAAMQKEFTDNIIAVATIAVENVDKILAEPDPKAQRERASTIRFLLDTALKKPVRSQLSPEQVDAFTKAKAKISPAALRASRES